jgi:hypothetical protein
MSQPPKPNCHRRSTRPGVGNEDISAGVHIVTGMAASVTSLAKFDAAFVTQPLTVLCAARGAPRHITPIDCWIEGGHPMPIAAQYPVSGASDRPFRPRLRG